MKEDKFKGLTLNETIPKVKFWLFLAFFLTLTMVSPYLGVIYLVCTSFLRYLTSRYDDTNYDLKEMFLVISVSIIIIYGQYNIHKKEVMADSREIMIEKYLHFIDNLTEDEYKEFNPTKNPYWNIYLNHKIGDRNIDE